MNDSLPEIPLDALPSPVIVIASVETPSYPLSLT